MCASTALERTILPIPDRTPLGPPSYDAKESGAQFPPITPLRPPSGAPNVLIILLDDVGFGASSAFGGPIHMPTAERLAANGLKYTRFHTTALCSPSRAALLTGRNHHSVGMGSVADVATSAPGYTSVRPNTAAPLAEVLKLNGYATAQFGKCHEVPVWETSPAGPFDRWPTGSGFEYFYGFIAGETHQYYPALYTGTQPIEVHKTPAEGYHLTEDLADQAITWVRQQKALVPDKPVFLYFAPGATHAPHHVPAEWSDKYRGQFDDGWDKLRAETFARQQELGIIPPDAALTARPAEIPAWDEMPRELLGVLSRQMEVYAGFLEHADHHTGRLVAALEELGILDDTLIYYIIGDNGASGEGTPNGTFNEMFVFNGIPQVETPQFLIDHIDQFGGPEAYNHFAVGWAHAMNTPYQWTKQVASHWGGTRNGTIVHWPHGMRARGEVRPQFHHLIDVAATVLEAANLPAPVIVNSVQQMPLHGVSMAYSFDESGAPERHTTQYFEIFVNRGIYHHGWTAVTRHSIPWLVAPMPALDDDVWELYGPGDWTQAHNLAAENPEKLRELQRLFLIEAARYNVLPLDDRRVERFDAEMAGRPTLVRGRTQLLYGGTQRLSENATINLKNRSHSVTAEVTVPDGAAAAGVIITQGGAFGGWALYAVDGRPRYCYNFAGLQRFYVEGERAIPPGTHQIRLEFAYDGGGLGKGGSATLYLDGVQIGTGRVEATMPLIFSGDETTDVGVDLGSPVAEDYGVHGNQFSGTVQWVQLDRGLDDTDHLISPEERWRVALAIQ